MRPPGGKRQLQRCVISSCFASSRSAVRHLCEMIVKLVLPHNRGGSIPSRGSADGHLCRFWTVMVRNPHFHGSCARTKVCRIQKTNRRRRLPVKSLKPSRLAAMLKLRSQTRRKRKAIINLLVIFERGRSSRPSSIFAAVIQALIACFTQMGTATVRILPPLPRRSMITHLPSLNVFNVQGGEFFAT